MGPFHCSIACLNVFKSIIPFTSVGDYSIVSPTDMKWSTVNVSDSAGRNYKSTVVSKIVIAVLYVAELLDIWSREEVNGFEYFYCKETRPVSNVGRLAFLRRVK